jgi:hypothetical protein
MDALHAQLTLFLNGGTYHNATCYFANYVRADQPLFPARILSYETSWELPDPLAGAIAKRSASITLSDKELNRKDSPTLAAILATEDIKGKRARFSLWNPQTGNLVYTLDGIIASIGRDYRTLNLEGEDPGLLQTLIPTTRAADIFPSLDASFTESKDPPPIVVFGPMPRVTLPLAVPTYLLFTATMAGTNQNKFLYADLDYVPDATVAAGDKLVYDVRWDTQNNLQAIDLQCTDNTKLRNTAAVDQNGLSAHPGTNINAYAFGRFYRREIDLAPIVGKTISAYMVACENDTAGSYSARICNAYILDADGNKKVTIFDESITSATITYVERDTASATATVSATRQWLFGPIRIPGGGTFTCRAVYTDGRVRNTNEWGIINFYGYFFVRFLQRPLDAQGRPAKVQADLDSTEFGRNPANILKFIWSDASMLNQSVDASSFSAAATIYTLLGDYENVVGGLAERKQALQVLRDLAFRGAFFDKTSNGAITISVDSSALHPAAPVDLGQQDTRSLNNAQLVTNNALDVSVAEQIKQLDYLAYLDPGLGASARESFLISATRSRATGGRIETVRSPYAGSGKMADRETDYLFKMLTGFDLDIEVSTGVAVGSQLTLGQLVKFYSPKHYFSGSQYLIRRIRFDGATFTLRLTGYDVNLFSYAPGKVTVSRLVDSFIDYSQTKPATPTSPTFVSATVVTASDGTVVSIERFRVTLPAVNCTELYAYAYRSGIAQAQPFKIVNNKSITLGTTNDIEIDVKAGTSYDIEFYAYNSANHPDFRFSNPALITGRVAAGDTTAPATVAGLVATAGTGKSINLSWTKNTELDLSEYIIYRGTTTNPTVEYARSRTNNFTDTNVAYDTTYFYRVKAVDFSGNASASFSANASALVRKVLTGDVDDNQITSAKRQPVNSTLISGITVPGNSAVANSVSHSVGRVPLVTPSFPNAINAVIGVIEATSTTINYRFYNHTSAGSTFDLTIYFW